MRGVATLILFGVIIAFSSSNTVPDEVLTRHIENALQDDEFSISISHIRPRRKAAGEDEILLAVEFSKTKDKFVLMLDRHTKRVILETAENGFSRSEHLVIDSLDVIDPIKNLVVVLRQKQPEAHLEIYADCLYQGEIPLKRTIREMSEIEDSSSLRVFRERRCRMKIHKSGDVDYVLKEENCPANMTDAFNDLKGIDESFKSDRIRRDREDRGDIPAPVFIGSDCVGAQDLSNIIQELVKYVKVIREELRGNTEETHRIRNLLDNCLACKVPPAPIVDPCTNFCYQGVRCLLNEYREPQCGACPERYTGDGRRCHRLPSCDDNPCFGSVRCYDTAEGYRCGPCPRGYTGDGRQCTRIRSGCDSNPCFHNVRCHPRDRDPYYSCDPCPRSMHGNGTHCSPDLPDLCDLETPCSPLTDCHNMNTGYRCGPCPPGYTGPEPYGYTVEDARRNRQKCVPITSSCNDGRNGGCVENSPCYDSEVNCP